MIYGIAHRTHAGSHIGLGRADSLAFRSCRPAGRPADVAVVVVVWACWACHVPQMSIRTQSLCAGMCHGNRGATVV